MLLHLGIILVAIEKEVVDGKDRVRAEVGDEYDADHDDAADVVEEHEVVLVRRVPVGLAVHPGDDLSRVLVARLPDVLSVVPFRVSDGLGEPVFGHQLIGSAEVVEWPAVVEVGRDDAVHEHDHTHCHAGYFREFAVLRWLLLEDAEDTVLVDPV